MWTALRWQRALPPPHLFFEEGTGFQAVRPQYADIGTSPFANTQDQEAKALISNLEREMEETRVANSQISLEPDEAIARNECLSDIVDKVRKQRAGGAVD